MDSSEITKDLFDNYKKYYGVELDISLEPHLRAIVENIQNCFQEITDESKESVEKITIDVKRNSSWNNRRASYAVFYFSYHCQRGKVDFLGFGIDPLKYQGLHCRDGMLLDENQAVVDDRIGIFFNRTDPEIARIRAEKESPVATMTIYGEEVKIEKSIITGGQYDVIWLPGRLINSGKSYREILEIALKDFFGDGTIKELKDLLEANMQLILTGAPGTGKTYKAMKIAELMIGDGNAETHIKKVQFHPGYDYSDFIIGLKPKLEDGGKFLSYEWEDGVFKKFADMAKDDPKHNYIFIVDEINRADLSNVFGEAFSLLEDGYRGEEHKITLPNGDEFIIPENLYVIGTMNDIDRSVESMDFALRRRFAWYEVSAEESKGIIDEKVQNTEIADLLKKSMDAVNGLITDKLGSEYQLGGAYFAKAVKTNAYDEDSTTDTQKLKDELWKNFIRVILTEYLRGRKGKEDELKKLEEAFNKPFDDAAESKNGDKKAGSSGGTGDSDTDSDTEA